MGKWFRRIGALFLVLLAAFFGLRERHHKRAVHKALPKINEAAERLGTRSRAAEAEREAARAHAKQAKRDVEKAKATIQAIREKTDDEKFATTVDRINARLAGRMQHDD